MKDKLFTTFDAIHAPNNWQAGVLNQLAAKRKKKPQHRTAFLLASATCAIFLLLGVVWFSAPVSYLSIDINPSVQLGLNRLDRVVTATGYNAEGKQLLSSLSLFFLPYEDAMEQILSAEQTEAYLANDLPVTITVEGNTAEKEEEILETASHCAESHTANVSCHHAASGLSQQADEAGLSLGKYRVYQQILQYDPAFSAEQAQDMTMRQLRDYLASLAPEVDTTSSHRDSTGCHNHTSSIIEESSSVSSSPTVSPAPTQSAPGCGQGKGQGKGNSMGKYNGHGKQSCKGT